MISDYYSEILASIEKKGGSYVLDELGRLRRIIRKGGSSLSSMDRIISRRNVLISFTKARRDELDASKRLKAAMLEAAAPQGGAAPTT